tara:strand:- start:327 stop:596 length:270 start_codon:yes stop_codon:yes gene_type:complete
MLTRYKYIVSGKSTEGSFDSPHNLTENTMKLKYNNDTVIIENDTYKWMLDGTKTMLHELKDADEDRLDKICMGKFKKVSTNLWVIEHIK